MSDEDGGSSRRSARRPARARPNRGGAQVDEEEEAVRNQLFGGKTGSSTPSSQAPKPTFDPKRCTAEQVQEFEAKMDDHNADILDGAIRQAAEAQQTGQATLAQLHSQGEQMKRIDGDLASINQNVTRSQRILRGIGSIGGAIANALTKPRSSPSTAMPAAEPASSSSASSKSTSTSTASSKNTANGNSNSKDKSSSQSQSQAQASKGKLVNSRTDEQLDVLSGLISNLKNQAQDMNGVLNEQDKMLDHLNTTVDYTDQRLQKTTRQVQKLI
jgi:hypothetical protein